MRTRVPDYYPRFRCLAGACPHSCCEGWEIVIDPASAQRYRALPGPLGERPCGGPGGCRLSRLGTVLHRAQGLDVRRLLLWFLHGTPGR